MNGVCNVSGCGRPIRAREMCNTHYHAWRRKAQKDGTFDNQKPRDLTERFWKFVEKSDDHWLWSGATNNKGYGRLITQHGNKTLRSAVMAHRFSYELHIGPIPDDMNVLHRCDTPACVRPEHLFLGTTEDNALDMVTKGRGRVPVRFTPEQADELREAYASGVSIANIAAFHGVSLPLVYKVIYRQQPYDV